MTKSSSANPLANLRVVYELPNAAEVTVRSNIPYAAADGETLTLDVYRPAAATDPLPVVLFVTGYSDIGMRAFVGCAAKDMQSYVSWARLIAGMGFAAVTYTTTWPATDVRGVVDHLRANSNALGLDPTRIAVWSCSGNVPNALNLLMDESFVCAVLCYGFMLDFDGNAVADASKAFHFVNPSAGRAISELRPCPTLVVKAGRDQMPGLNASIDQFVAKAQELNRPVTVVVHPEGPHAFDLVDDTEASRHAIRSVLDFVRIQLGAAT
jgi:acetyl esterase/lipase